MVNSILVVCTGNICRSPFAERLLRQQFPNKKIDSAGTGALVGYEADKLAIVVAKKMGISLDKHSARQINDDICRQYELILVMEQYHKSCIANISPISTGKTMFLGQWLQKNQTIADPYRKDEDYFYLVFTKIKEAVEKWKNKL